MVDVILLYVEDDEMSREVMSILVETSLDSAELILFEDSKNFAQRMQNLPYLPHIIMLDIHILPLDGFAMLEHLRNDPTYKDARIIALTASVMNEEVQRLREAGFDGVIGKPIDQLRFPEIINRLLAGEQVWHIR